MEPESQAMFVLNDFPLVPVTPKDILCERLGCLCKTFLRRLSVKSRVRDDRTNRRTMWTTLPPVEVHRRRRLDRYTTAPPAVEVSARHFMVSGALVSAAGETMLSRLCWSATLSHYERHEPWVSIYLFVLNLFCIPSRWPALSSRLLPHL